MDNSLYVIASVSDISVGSSPSWAFIYFFNIYINWLFLFPRIVVPLLAEKRLRSFWIVSGEEMLWHLSYL